MLVNFGNLYVDLCSGTAHVRCGDCVVYGTSNNFVHQSCSHLISAMLSQKQLEKICIECERYANNNILTVENLYFLQHQITGAHSYYLKNTGSVLLDGTKCYMGRMVLPYPVGTKYTTLRIKGDVVVTTRANDLACNRLILDDDASLTLSGELYIPEQPILGKGSMLIFDDNGKLVVENECPAIMEPGKNEVTGICINMLDLLQKPSKSMLEAVVQKNEAEDGEQTVVDAASSLNADAPGLWQGEQTIVGMHQHHGAGYDGKCEDTTGNSQDTIRSLEQTLSASKDNYIHACASGRQNSQAQQSTTIPACLRNYRTAVEALKSATAEDIAAVGGFMLEVPSASPRQFERHSRRSGQVGQRLCFLKSIKDDFEIALQWMMMLEFVQLDQDNMTFAGRGATAKKMAPLRAHVGCAFRTGEKDQSGTGKEQGAPGNKGWSMPPSSPNIVQKPLTRSTP